MEARRYKKEFEICNLPNTEKQNLLSSLIKRFGDRFKIKFTTKVKYKNRILLSEEGFTRAYISICYEGLEINNIIHLFNELSGGVLMNGVVVTSSELQRDYYSKGKIPNGYHIQGV